MKGDPVPMAVPPVGTSYQFNTVPVPVAASVTVVGPGPQASPGVVLVICGLFNVTVTSPDVLVFPLQLATSLKYIVCVIGLPSVKGDVVAPGIFVNPVPGVVLCCHCKPPYPVAPVVDKVGVPPVIQYWLGLAETVPAANTAFVRFTGGIASLPGFVSPDTDVKALKV